MRNDGNICTLRLKTFPRDVFVTSPKGVCYLNFGAGDNGPVDLDSQLFCKVKKKVEISNKWKVFGVRR